LSLITGALPAQYGLRTAGIVDITTAKLDNVGQVGVYGGSRGTTSYSAQYGGITGSTEYFFSGRFLNTILGIENPTSSLNAIHDGSHQDRGFAYISTIIDPTTRLSFIGGTATNWFQIPNRPGLLPSFTAFGVTNFPSAQLDETQLERYRFGVLALQKSTNDVDIQLAYFMRTSSIQFMPDTLGDLMFNGVATNVYRGSVVNGVQGAGAFRVNEAHTLRAGVYVSAEKTTVSSNSQLLPLDGSMSPPGQNPVVPDTPFQAIDTSALLGWLGGVYLQDEWKLTDRLTLNTGARFDQMWQYQNANQLSPRVSLTYNPFDGTTFHAGYARYFTPPVQVIAAPTNTSLFTACPPAVQAALPSCTTAQAPSVPPPYNPMLPERANVYDIGVVQKVWPGLELGADFYLKQARDLIDDGQFGAALVLNGFNYDKAENIGTELKAVYTNGNFRAYANWAWAFQRATIRVSNQYLFDPLGNAFTANNWIFTDHTQIWTGSGGVSYLWNGTRLSADVIYGSGLRSGFENTDHNAPYAQVNTGLSHEFFIPGWNPVTLRFDVINLFDVSYAIRNGTGVGVFAPQYGPRRGYYFGLAQKFGPGANKKPATPPAYVPIFKTPAATVWTWTGYYLGINGGLSQGRASTDAFFNDITIPASFATSAAYNLRGKLFGVQTGYNFQAGNWLWGIEGDLQLTSVHGNPVFTCPGMICNPAGEVVAAFDQNQKIEWLGTLRGRVGLAVAPYAFAYVTGGAAVAGLLTSGTVFGFPLAGAAFPTNPFSNLAVNAGWTAGGGIEARLSGHWTGKIEYLYMDFGNMTTNINNQTAMTLTAMFNSHITDQLVRAGINYKFD
jgi:outer membrane receptor protein involved in Fe transport